MVAVAPLRSLRSDHIRFAGWTIYRSEISPETAEVCRRVLPQRGLYLNEYPRSYSIASLCAQCGEPHCMRHSEREFRALLGDDDKWIAVLNAIGGAQFFATDLGAHYSVEEVADLYGTDAATLAKIIGEQMVDAAQNERPEGWW